MPHANWTPSIVPHGDDWDVYLVVADFGQQGRAWRETECRGHGLWDGHPRSVDGPVRVVSFNTVEGWSRDISGDVAEEIRRRCEREVPAFMQGFVERHMM
jgi:hypothetical protein